MMEHWTNGLWKSTLHRVIHNGTNYRVSVPFFFEPNWDTVVAPLEKCVAETGGKRNFEGVKYGDHLVGKIKGNFY
jgi:isopenicillin N synthase-like dioxygenase